MALLSRLFYLLIYTAVYTATAFADSPVNAHGNLSVKGNLIVDSQGQAVSLAGPSFFWSNTGWGAEKYYNADVVNYFAREWKAGIIRAAIGGHGPGGYGKDPKGNIKRAEALIDAAIQEGIYIVVDWHSHAAEKRPENAIEFFTHIAKKYGDKANIIYEIYNEPMEKTSWEDDIKPYSRKVIPAIRKYDPDNLIVVGTQKWSQKVDEASKSPLSEFNNIVYALHFYAASHKEALREKAQTALDNGVPLMVTEWGAVSSNGDGAIDAESVKTWMKFIKDNKMSHCNWSVHDKKEGASILKPGTKGDGKWTDADLTETGLFVKNIIQNW